MATPIGTLGTIPTVCIGGVLFPDPFNDATFINLVTANTNLSYSTFFTQDGVAYQVPNGKSLYINAAQIWSETNNSYVSLGYGDNSVGLNNATPPTTPVYRGGDVSTARIIMRGSSTLLDPTGYAYYFVVPQAKYPFMNDPSVANTTVQIFGYVK